MRTVRQLSGLLPDCPVRAEPHPPGTRGPGPSAPAGFLSARSCLSPCFVLPSVSVTPALCCPSCRGLDKLCSPRAGPGTVKALSGRCVSAWSHVLTAPGRLREPSSHSSWRFPSGGPSGGRCGRWVLPPLQLTGAPLDQPVIRNH